MGVKHCVVLLGALLATTTATGAASALDLADLADLARPAVVRLSVSDASGRKIGGGTGFFVSADGRVVTNYHVIKDAGSVSATLSTGKEVSVLGILASDDAKDIAILKVQGSGYPTLALGDSKTLRAGHKIAVIGHPLGLAGSLSEGIVSAIREDGVGEESERRWSEQIRAWGIQIQAPISPGSSGSPIINTAGEVVGVAVGALTEGQGLNFGIPIEVPKALLAGLAPDTKLTPFGGVSSKGATRNLIISGVLFASLLAAYFVWGRRESSGARRPPKSGRGARPS
jgi:S1-C subfamily serine protease